MTHQGEGVGKKNVDECSKARYEELTWMNVVKLDMKNYNLLEVLAQDKSK